MEDHWNTFNEADLDFLAKASVFKEILGVGLLSSDKGFKESSLPTSRVFQLCGSSLLTRSRTRSCLLIIKVFLLRWDILQGIHSKNGNFFRGLAPMQNEALCE